MARREEVKVTPKDNYILMGRKNFIDNLANTISSMLILKEDPEFPLHKDREYWLDEALRLIERLHKLETQDYAEAIAQSGRYCQYCRVLQCRYAGQE